LRGRHLDTGTGMSILRYRLKTRDGTEFAFTLLIPSKTGFISGGNETDENTG
jgi:hypothetical protein